MRPVARASIGVHFRVQEPGGEQLRHGPIQAAIDGRACEFPLKAGRETEAGVRHHHKHSLQLCIGSPLGCPLGGPIDAEAAAFGRERSVASLQHPLHCVVPLDVDGGKTPEAVRSRAWQAPGAGAKARANKTSESATYKVESLGAGLRNSQVCAIKTIVGTAASTTGGFASGYWKAPR